MSQSAIGSVRDARRLIILRHGRTRSNALGIWQGQLDHELDELGLEQARAAGVALAALRPSRVISSDLLRARVTAEEVAAASGCAMTTDPRLREIHGGQWQGLSTAEVFAADPSAQARLSSGEDFVRGETGESLADVAERSRAAVTELLGTMGAGECVVLATHGVTGRVLAGDLIGLDLRQSWLMLGGFGNCHWAVLEEGRSGWRITRWNANAAGA